MGKHDFLSLLWTWTAFCTPRVLEAFRENDFKGYDVFPVWINKAGDISQTVSQLIFPLIAGSGLADRDKRIEEGDWGWDCAQYAVLLNIIITTGVICILSGRRL